MPTYELINVNKLVSNRFVNPYFLSMNPFFDELSIDHILHFIRSYRRLEKMPLEDGFAELACVAKSNQPAEEKRLRQHFRNHWYSKERAFGRFYLNLPHYRQLYLLHQWDLVHYEDATYLWECERDGRFALMAQAPPLARQLHALVLFFENHGINRQLTAAIELENVPTEFDQRFGNSANWPGRRCG